MIIQVINILINQRGLINVVFAEEFKDSFDIMQLSQRLFEKGFVFGFKHNTLRFLPPLMITGNEVDKLILNLRDLLSD